MLSVYLADRKIHASLFFWIPNLPLYFHPLPYWGTPGHSCPQNFLLQRICRQGWDVGLSFVMFQALLGSSSSTWEVETKETAVREEEMPHHSLFCEFPATPFIHWHLFALLSPFIPLANIGWMPGPIPDIEVTRKVSCSFVVSRGEDIKLLTSKQAICYIRWC